MNDINILCAQALNAYKLGNNDPVAGLKKEFFSWTPPGGLAGLKVLIHSSIYPTHTCIGQLRKNPLTYATPFHQPVRQPAESLSQKFQKKICTVFAISKKAA